MLVTWNSPGVGVDPAPLGSTPARAAQAASSSPLARSVRGSHDRAPASRRRPSTGCLAAARGGDASLPTPDRAV